MVIYNRVDCGLINKPSGPHAGIHLPAYVFMGFLRLSLASKGRLPCVFVFCFFMKQN